jgi:hypothetical protein
MGSRAPRWGVVPADQGAQGYRDCPQRGLTSDVGGVDIGWHCKYPFDRQNLSRFSSEHFWTHRLTRSTLRSTNIPQASDRRLILDFGGWRMVVVAAQRTYHYSILPQRPPCSFSNHTSVFPQLHPRLSLTTPRSQVIHQPGGM